MSLAHSFGAVTSTNDADTLTAVEFDRSGDYLATGDQGGRVVLFSRVPDTTSSHGRARKGTSPGNDEAGRGRALVRCDHIACGR